MSVSAASRIACFQLGCTGDSREATIRVPICTPSAPSAKQAAMVAPSQTPPAAMIGTPTFSRTSGSSTMLITGCGFLKPPPSPPSTISPSTPASTAFIAAFSVGTTWNTVRPAAFSGAQYLAGSPAEVVTNLIPSPMTKSTIEASRTKAWAMFTPNGLSVSWRILRISSRIASSSPDEVSMIPSPPALETAEASCARAIQPIGAWTMGYSIPSMSVMRLRIFIGSCFRGGRQRLRSRIASAVSASTRVPELSPVASALPMPSRLRLKTPWPIEASRKIENAR